jgi:uncharacterized protein YifE (UPF0438 family)
MNTKDSFYSNSKFYSDRHFPYGFARSGKFTLEQAALLERHGKAYEALHNGSREPVNKEEKSFVTVCRGEAEPVTEHEKVWMLYCKAITKKPAISPFGAIIKKDIQRVEIAEDKLSEVVEDELSEDIEEF